MKNCHDSARLTHFALTVPIASPAETVAFDAQLTAHHYLGAGRPVGDYLPQFGERTAVLVALPVWDSSCDALKDRHWWIGWNSSQRVTYLKSIVQNRRFLMLTAKRLSPNLAFPSHGRDLARAVRSMA